MKDVDIIKGLIIGGILLWIFTRRNDMSMQNMQHNLQQSQVGIYGWKPLNNMTNFDDLDFAKYTPLPVVDSKSSEIVEQKVAEQTSKEVEQISGNGTEYKNNETWKIARDENGDISEISVMRNAKVT